MSDGANSIKRTSNGDFILVGNTSSFGSSGDEVYAIKVNMFGDTLWTRAYGQLNTDAGLEVALTMDGGYIIAGLTNSFGLGTTDIYFIKIDSNGQVGCHSYGTSTITTNVIIQTTRNGLVGNAPNVLKTQAQLSTQAFLGHTICSPFVGMNGGINQNADYLVRVYPNPFNDNCIISISKPISAASSNVLKVYDLLGSLKFQLSFEGNSVIIYQGSLASGSYFYAIESDQVTIGAGKLMVY